MLKSITRHLSTITIRQWLCWLTVIALLGTMLTQMLYEAAKDGASTDEQIHILSGYTTITQGHVLFDPEHPFLAKAIAAIPLLFIHPDVPQAATNLTAEQAQPSYNTYREANQWGYEMLFTFGNNPDQLLFLTRAVIAILTTILAAVVFIWTKSLWGLPSALAALAIIAFEPSIIAHGHLANDDTVATLFFIAAIAAFHTFLKRPTYRTILLTGLILGLGLITKYSLLLLGPIFIILLIGWLTIHRDYTSAIIPPIFTTLSAQWQRYTAGLIAIFLTAWSVIWLSYGSLMLINPDQNPASLTGLIQLPAFILNSASVILPAMYAKGALLLFGPSSHGRDGYLLGACYNGGRLDYFTVVTFFKTPLTTLFLFATSCIIWLRTRGHNHFVPAIILVPLIIYLGISSFSSINIGYRHVLPVGVLIIIAAAYPVSLIDWPRLGTDIANIGRRVISTLMPSINNSPQGSPSSTATSTSIYGLLILIALTASLIGSILAFPNHLAYYNILSGEPHNRPFISADSNADWGQGTKALYEYMRQHHINQVALDNFTGTAEAESRGYPISAANPHNHNYTGYLALSRSTIIDHYCTKNNDWGWVVDHHDPIAIVGGSINVYKLD